MVASSNWDVVRINTGSTWVCTVSLSLLWSVCLLLQDQTVAVWDIKSHTDITLRTVLEGQVWSAWYAVELSETNVIAGSLDNTIKVQTSCEL